MNIVVTLVAPIPVGHRVRLTFHERDQGGLFSRSSVELEHEPVIEDLDTGIVYCSDRPYQGGAGKHPNEPYGVTFDPGPVSRVVEGVVRSCRVLTVRTFSEVDVQTHLSLQIG